MALIQIKTTRHSKGNSRQKDTSALSLSLGIRVRGSRVKERRLLYTEIERIHCSVV